jgi:hypothetical protein
MPKFTIGEGYAADFFTVPLATANGEFVVADGELIRIRTEAGEGRPAGFENYIGRFTYTKEGLPLGTIDEYRFVTLDEAPVYRIAHAGISVLELREAAAASGDDPQALLRLIFRADDVLIGGALGDTMRAFAGDDLVKGKGGDDWLGGMSGRDRLMGNAGDDELRGGGKGDALLGGTGDDRLDGGRGANRLTGGDGEDTFVFRVAGKANRITDFGEGDGIALGFGSLGEAGPLDPAAFHRGATAQTPEQRILYDAETGWLLYAREGSLTPDPLVFARIGKHIAHLDAADFVVI